MKANDLKPAFAVLCLATLIGCATGGPAADHANHDKAGGAPMGMGDMKAMCEMHRKRDAGETVQGKNRAMPDDMTGMSAARQKHMLEMQERCK